MKTIDLQTLGSDWRLVHTDEARWSPMAEHEYSVSLHAARGVWVVSYFEPGAETGMWIEDGGPTDSQHVHAFQAAKAAEQHWAKHRGLRIVNPSADLRPGVLDATAEHAFTYGACEILAVAMHDQLGWPLVKITDAHNAYARKDTQHTLEGASDAERAKTTNTAGGGSALHWMVLRPDGQLVDVDGAHDPLEMVERYNDHADQDQAAIGRSDRAEALEEAENKGTTVPLSLASTFVAPVLARARTDNPVARAKQRLLAYDFGSR